jgi:hypothetical protein
MELNPDDGRVLFSLGLAYYDKGDKVRALEYLKSYKERYSQYLHPGERKKLET